MTTANDGLLLELLERVRNRFYGKYRGTVTQIDNKTLRLKAKVPAVLADIETGWCVACVPYAGNKVGMAFLPEPGAGVWIEFEGGDVSYPIWSGCYWRDGETPDEADGTVKTFITGQDVKFISGTQGSDSRVELTSDTASLKHGDSRTVVVDSDKVDVNGGALEVT